MKFLLPLVLLSATAFAETTEIFRDEKYVVSVEEKPSRPGAKGKGHCGAGQEIFLQPTDAVSKKQLINELIESCIKEIDLEESVDDSVVSLDKKIFIYQEKAMGVLDLTAEKPEYKTTGTPPEEIKSVVMRLENCHHWGGEEPTDEKRQKEITANMNKLGCEKLPVQIEALKKKYATDATNLLYLEAAVKEYQ